MDIIEKAKKIALCDLQACYEKWGVYASLVNFSDYWARDSFWAVFGMLEIGDTEKAKKTLLLFMKYQHKNGKISRKISIDFNRLKYVFKIKIKRLRPKPVYSSPLRSSFAMDDNLLFVLSFCQYVGKSGDLDFARRYFLKVRSALEFYYSKKVLRGCLLDEHGLSSWMDTVFKQGHVLYTNCLWYKAICQFEKLSDLLGYVRSRHVPPSNMVKQSIRDIFWLPNKNYYADSVDKSNKVNATFDLVGNSLAIIYTVATQDQSKMILRKISSTADQNSGLHPVNDPVYPWYRINPFATVAGIYRYHNGISWSWAEAITLLAYLKSGSLEEAGKCLFDQSANIVKNNHVYESCTMDGKPFGNFFWKSAVPFAWSSGLYLYAVANFEKSTQKPSC